MIIQIDRRCRGSVLPLFRIAMLFELSYLYTSGVGHFGPFLTNCLMLYVLMSWSRIVLKHFHRMALSWKSQESTSLTFYCICLAYNLVTCFAFGLDDTNAAQALSKLLANVTFHIPDIVLMQDGITMEINNFYCKDIALSDLIIEDEFSSKTIDALQVEASGLQIDCNGDFDAKRGRFLHISGTIDAKIDESSIGGEIDFLMNNELAPSQATLKDCKVALNFKELKLSGGLLIDIVNLFSPLIKKAIENNIQDLVCTPIEPLVNTNLTKLLQTYDSIVDLVGIVPGNEAKELIPADEILTNQNSIFDFHSVDQILNAVHKILGAEAHNHKLMIDNVVDLMVEDGQISLEPDYTIQIGDDGLSRTNITIETVKITGLDSLSHLDLLYNIDEKYPTVKSNYSLGFSMNLDQLQIHLNGSVTLSPGSFIYHSDGPLTLAAGALVDLENLKLNVLVELPIFEDIVKNMNIGDLLHNSLFCIIDMIDLKDTNIRLLDVNMGNFTIATTGFAGVAPLFNDLINVILDIMEPSMEEIIRGASENILRLFINSKISDLPDIGSLCQGWSEEDQIRKQNVFNEFLMDSENEILQYAIKPLIDTVIPKQKIARTNNVYKEQQKNTNNQPNFQDHSNKQHHQERDNKKKKSKDKKYVNFTDGKFWKFFDYLVDDLFGIKSPISYNIDDLIDTFVNVGYWNKSNLLDTTLNIGVEGLKDVKIKINEVVLDGLDHIDVFEILEPINATELHSTINLNEFKMILDLEFELNGSGINNGKGSYQHLKFDVELTNFGFHTKTNVLLREDDFYNTTIDEFMACPTELFDELKFFDMSMKFDNIFVNLTCVNNNCSEGFKELGEVWIENSEALNKAIQKAIVYLFDSEKGVFVYGFNHFLTNKIEKSCNASSKSKDGKDMEKLVWGVGTSIVCLLIIVICSFHMRKCYLKEKYGDFGRHPKPAVNSATQYNAFQDGSGSNVDENTEAAYWKKDNMLMYSPKVPKSIRYLVPIIIVCLGHAAFFIANFTNGCGINVRIELAGDVYDLPNVSQMALIDTIKDMWNAGVYPLALLIGFLSGLWPHIKFIMMMMCWVFPYPSHERGLAMLWLDALGKWGLIDVYVLVLCMAAFSFYIAPHNVSYLPEDFMSITVYAVPETAIFFFIIGMIISLIVTHVVTHYHREEVQRKHLQDHPQDYETKETLKNHNFECYTGEEGHKNSAQLSTFGVVSVCILIVLSIGLYAFGSKVDSFYFSFEGAIQYLMNPTATYSFFGVSARVLSSNNYSIGAWVINIIFIVFAFGIPVASLVLSLALFLLPLNLRQHKKLFTIVECLFAWASTEVFLVAVIAAMLEVNQYAQFLFAAAEPLNPLLIFVLPEDVSMYRIFNIATGFKKGVWLLWGAVFSWVLVTQTVIRLAERSIRDRRGLTEKLWNSEDHEACCEDTVGFRVLSFLRLVSTRKHYRSSTISSLTSKIGFHQDLTGTLV